ncbi:MAG: lipid-A-disaccharide synthase, partial [Alistipes sp.]|nr:lipid-A-disaccharide synthase [Alistipes sp.]
MKYYLLAGDPSGDLHGANLIKGLRKADAEAQFRFWGGDLMAEAGGAANLAKHYRETSFFGIVQVLRNLKTIRRQLRECQDDVAAYAPDALILVDYPGFNMKMARWAKEHGIRTIYYIAPKVWAWREWRVEGIRRFVDLLLIIFPFERNYFANKGIKAVFEGNPLEDAIEARRPTLPTADEFRRTNGLDERPIVALLAGSRRGEIRDNLPLMARLAEKFPAYQFVVAGVHWLDKSLYDRY